MKRRTIGLGFLVALGAVTASLATGCSDEGHAEEQHGTLNLPLLTQGPSGTTYRLRDATFEIVPQSYYYYSSGGEGGSGPGSTIISSETDPNAGAISVELERGYYYIRLQPGWHMEKIVNGVATDVEATLLSGETQWVYVAERSSTWVEYQFGLGGRALWFNGELNVQIGVYEKPSDLYGGAGAGGGGDTGFGGDTSTGGI